MAVPIHVKIRVESPEVLSHWCRGCNRTHSLQFAGIWDYDPFNPTFKKQIIAAEGGCIYTLKDGVVSYHKDSKHMFAGETHALSRM